MPPFLRGTLLGLLLPFAVGMPLAAIGLQHVRDSPFVGTFARMFESPGPQILAASLIPIALIAIVGARRIAAACLALALLCGGGLVVEQWRAGLPLVPTASADLRLVWLNANFRNPLPPERIVDAIRASGADLVMLAESKKVGPHLDSLSDLYPYRAGCIETCEISVLSRYPIDNLVVRGPGNAWKERLFLFGLTVPGKAPVTIVALHMSKPWFYGIIDQEIDTVEEEVRKRPGPMVLAGDLNSAPWSLRLHWLRWLAGLRPPTRPVPTWPDEAGPLGIPIDHVLVRGGPRIVSIAPWGADLGSDHRGLIAELSLPPAS
ncbi:MAG: endonuclease/exonuclease/phosphatase family protein [Rhodobacteraceae bacterium]|nr:endonuclease/exonuclease/phosphatase family protein [Paracoccaceae bacterium]